VTPIVLFYLGGPSIQPFAYTFFVGLVAGTFSSIAIAAPLVFVPGGESPEQARGPATDAAPAGA
jgi:preprotein translocase subunit SecF